MSETLDLIQSATVSLPALEVTILLVALTVCMLFEVTRIGLVVSYLFVYRWGWLFFQAHNQGVLVAYMIFGCVTGILAVLGMIHTARAARKKS